MSNHTINSIQCKPHSLEKKKPRRLGVWHICLFNMSIPVAVSWTDGMTKTWWEGALSKKSSHMRVLEKSILERPRGTVCMLRSPRINNDEDRRKKGEQFAANLMSGWGWKFWIGREHTEDGERRCHLAACVQKPQQEERRIQGPGRPGLDPSFCEFGRLLNDNYADSPLTERACWGYDNIGTQASQHEWRMLTFVGHRLDRHMDGFVEVGYRSQTWHQRLKNRSKELDGK